MNAFGNEYTRPNRSNLGLGLVNTCLNKKKVPLREPFFKNLTNRHYTGGMPQTFIMRKINTSFEMNFTIDKPAFRVKAAGMSLRERCMPYASRY